MPLRKQLSKYVDVATRVGVILVFDLWILVSSEVCRADVDNSLRDIQYKMTHIVGPTLSIISLAWAGFTFLIGHENSKRNIWYALLGTAIAFGSGIISDFIRSMVH